MMFRFADTFVIRNILGIALLLGVHFVGDRYHFFHRAGIQQSSPYFFLLLLYGWIVVHNRFLFERFYEANRLAAYAGWTLSIMIVGSVNMHLVLTYMFDLAFTLPQILGFWVYTFAGLGIYVFYRRLSGKREASTVALPKPELANASHFELSVDGRRQAIATADIQYVESFENYVKLFCPGKFYVLRLPMKEAEERLRKAGFIRVSRSHIVNVAHVTAITSDQLLIGNKAFKIGKVYKRYVEERFSTYAAKSGTA